MVSQDGFQWDKTLNMITSNAKTREAYIMALHTVVKYFKYSMASRFTPMLNFSERKKKVSPC